MELIIYLVYLKWFFTFYIQFAFASKYVGILRESIVDFFWNLNHSYNYLHSLFKFLFRTSHMYVSSTTKES